MLALPEFDTYGIIPRFARNPNDSLAMSGFLMLKERAIRGIDWSLHSMLQYRVGVDRLLAYRLGHHMPEPTLPVQGDSKATRTYTTKPLNQMSEAQLKEVYFNALKSAGISVDPAASMNNTATQTPSSDGKL